MKYQVDIEIFYQAGYSQCHFWGFQDLHMDAVADSEVKTHDSNTDVFASNASSSRSHHTLNMSNRSWKFTTNLALLDTCS